MKLSPSFRAPLFPSPLPSSPSVVVLFLPIPLHPYCRCNPRYSAELSSPRVDFFRTLQLAIVDPATLLNPAKNASVLPPFYNITSPEADIIPRNISLLVFTVRPFFASRLPSPYIENNSSSNLYLHASRSHQIPYNVSKDA